MNINFKSHKILNYLNSKNFSVDVNNYLYFKKNRYDDKTTFSFWKTQSFCTENQSYNLKVHSNGMTFGEWICDDITHLNAIFCQKVFFFLN